VWTYNTRQCGIS